MHPSPTCLVRGTVVAYDWTGTGVDSVLVELDAVDQAFIRIGRYSTSFFRRHVYAEQMCAAAAGLIGKTWLVRRVPLPRASSRSIVDV